MIKAYTFRILAFFIIEETLPTSSVFPSKKKLVGISDYHYNEKT